MWKVVFPGRVFSELRSFLFSAAPRENGCFLTTTCSRTKSGNSLLVTGVLKPDKGSWNRMGEHALEPNSSYTNNCVVAADFKNEGLAFVHTHPNSRHPSHFSLIDEESNERIFANLSQILNDRPLGSLVFSRNGIYGVVYDESNVQPVSSYVISGEIMTEIPTVSTRRKITEINQTFDRQVRAIGKEGQIRLQKLKVVIVGVGGTGSSVAVQLARMGIGKLTLIDNDVLNDSNLSRVYGSEKGDKGKPKVKVLKRHIAKFTKIEVDTISADVTKSSPNNKAVSELIDSDVIFGCTDNLSSRAVLNDISLQYYIPLIDIGCRIYLDMNNEVNQAVCKVQVVTPDNACLWCTGTLDGRLILQETFSDEEKSKLAEEGYYEDVNKQPSIVSLTTMAASMGVNKLLALLGTYGEDYNSKTQIELKNAFMIDETPQIQLDCICQKRRGKGDSRRIL